MSGYEVQADCKLAIGVRVDDWWRLGCRPSDDHSDHLDLFLTALRHQRVAALLLFAPTGPAFSSARRGGSASR